MRQKFYQKRNRIINKLKKTLKKQENNNIKKQMKLKINKPPIKYLTKNKHINKKIVLNNKKLTHKTFKMYNKKII